MSIHTPSTLQLRLRAATRPSHERLETGLDLLDPAMTAERYRLVLTRFYGFYEPLEARLASAGDWRTLGYDFDARRKTGLLEADLHALGLSAGELEQLPRCRDLPRIDGLASALGVLYVIEGSTLGGQLLSRHVETCLGFTRERGCRFFTSYGAEVGRRWQQFRAFLDGHVGESDEQQALDAAVDTFERLDAWLVTQESGGV